MVTKKLNEKKIIQVKNVGGCTNFGALAFSGNTMYTVKTKSGNRLSYVSVYKNYTKTTRSNHKYANCMNHGNGMAYANGHLYVATCESWIVDVDTKTWKRVVIPSPYLSSIAHVEGNKFVIGSGGSEYHKLSLVEIANNKVTVLKKWTVKNPKYAAGYTVTQDIGYNKKNGCVYLVHTKNNYRTNVILRAKLYATEPDIIYTSKTSSSGKYEIESLDFNSAGKMIICMNLPSGKDSTFSTTL